MSERARLASRNRVSRRALDEIAIFGPVLVGCSMEDCRNVHAATPPASTDRPEFGVLSELTARAGTIRRVISRLTLKPAPRTIVTLVTASALLAGGCSSASPSPHKTGSPNPASTSASSSPSKGQSRPTGPATAELTLTGSSGIAGPLKVGGIECDLPGIASSSIFVLARPAEPAATVRVSFLPKAVIVAVVTGSGTKYRSRTFVGAGMTSFDAATGAHVNSPLVEAKQAGSSGGSLGTVSSISGIVDCGSQTSGHTTITLTGQTATGALSHSVIHPVKVTCTALAAGASVNIIGITRAGSSTVEVVIGVQSTAFTVSISAKGSKPQSFSSSTGTATASAHGAHIDGAVSEAATSHTLQVSGDATCGK